ncbi:unnamed protein product [Ambrosiozyma monospora]|uniref:Unnamed protein product n=1 Tax=Ambrosiozyma monospora TaxID=43982 RepID=A0ACB5SVU6_AMBMO|nr:unnamed protein product [Ambrosiozyma monospora]
MAPNGKSQGDGIVSKKPRLVKTQSGAIDHLAISQSLGYQIFRKQKRKAWLTEEDDLLKKLVIELFLKRKLEESGQQQQRGKLKYNNEKVDVELINWEEIAASLPARKPKDCRKRWCSSLDPCLRKGKWTKDEDDLLIKAYKAYGPAWQKVASQIEGRTEDQCSKRYIEVLNPDTKDRLKPWTLEEDLQLIEGVKKYGTKWRTIAGAIKE